MINHIISKCSKSVQKEYKIRHDRVEKVIHGELCKKFKFDYMNKWYIHNPEFILENEMNKVLCDFEIQIDYLILARQPSQGIVIKNREPGTVCFDLVWFVGFYGISTHASHLTPNPFLCK